MHMKKWPLSDNESGARMLSGHASDILKLGLFAGEVAHQDVMLVIDWCDGTLLWVFPKIIQYPVGWWGWASIVENVFSDPIFSVGTLSTFIHLSLGKAGPFTLENHIYVKALKMQGFPNS